MKKITFLLLALFAFGLQANAQSTINITTSGGSYATEKWVSITTGVDGAGTQIWGQGDGTYGNGQGLINEDISIAPGTYYVNCYDRYSDGWDNTLISVTAYGTVIGDNGGVSPSDPSTVDADNTWETPADELEASFVIVVPNPPACSPPISIADAAVSSTETNITWSAGATESDWTYEYMDTGVAQGAGTTGTATGTGAVNITGLTAGNTYDIYVQANCGAGNGDSTFAVYTWTQPTEGSTCGLPISLTVEADCSTATPYTMDYSTATDLGTSDLSCDTFGTNTGAWFSFTAPSTGAITVNTTDNNEILIIDSCGGTEILCNSSTSTSTQNILNLTSGATYYLAAWKDSATTGTTDICLAVFTPPVLPLCAANVTATPDAACGTSNTALSWDAVADADGYNITVGTTAGGNDVLDNVDLGDVTTSTIGAQTVSTTYYVTLVPYNITGDATGCTEITYMTNATGCYCDPSSTGTNTTTFIDNVSTTGGTLSNISNLASGLSANHYVNNYATMSVTSYEGDSFDFDVAIQDGTIGLAIWVDWNNDLEYEVSEAVFTTTGYGHGPFTGTIAVPAGTANGDYYMRIMADWNDSNPGDDSACSLASGRGETEDYKITIADAPTCTSPAATTTIVPDCANEQFYVEVAVTALGDGAPQISDGTNSIPVTATGTVTVGPFPSGTSYTLTLTHGTDSACDLALGAITYTCPPANDDCAGAIVLTAENDIATLADATQIAGSIIQSSDSGIAGCAGTANDDIWYSFVATADTINIDVTDDFDGVIELFSGACGTLVSIECDDYDATFGNPRISRTDYVVGDTYYVRVFYYYSSVTTSPDFTLALWSPNSSVLSTTNFNEASLFTYYPNPVKNTLTLKAQKTIDAVSVYNMLGQEVLRTVPNAVSNTMDMANLQSGAYFVKVTVGQATQTVRIIKN